MKSPVSILGFFAQLHLGIDARGVGISVFEMIRGVKIFRRIATALRDVVCVMTRMDGSADFSG